MEHPNQQNINNANWYNPNQHANYNHNQNWPQPNVQSTVPAKPLGNHFQTPQENDNLNLQPHLQPPPQHQQYQQDQRTQPQQYHQEHRENYYTHNAFLPTPQMQTNSAPNLPVNENNPIMASFENNQGDGWGDWDWNDNKQQTPKETITENHNYNQTSQPEVAMLQPPKADTLQNINTSTANFFDHVTPTKPTLENHIQPGFVYSPPAQLVSDYQNNQDVNVPQHSRPSSNNSASFQNSQDVNAQYNRTVGFVNQQIPFPNEHVQPPNLLQYNNDIVPQTTQRNSNADAEQQEYYANIAPQQAVIYGSKQESRTVDDSVYQNLETAPPQARSGNSNSVSTNTNNEMQCAPIRHPNDVNAVSETKSAIESTQAAPPAGFSEINSILSSKTEDIAQPSLSGPQTYGIPLIPATSGESDISQSSNISNQAYISSSQPLQSFIPEHPLPHPSTTPNHQVYHNSRPPMATTPKSSTPGQHNYPDSRPPNSTTPGPQPSTNYNQQIYPMNTTTGPQQSTSSSHNIYADVRPSIPTTPVQQELSTLDQSMQLDSRPIIPTTSSSSATNEIRPPPQITAAPQLPPPMGATRNVSDNPFKRSGQVQHHRSDLLPSAPRPINPPQQFFAPPPDGFANATENSEIVQPLSIPEEHVINTNDRNEYLQTSHLSEENMESNHQEQNNDVDNFPPPGLSRLVLGQPETESQPFPNNNDNNEIPPDFDRLIPGTELESPINLERQADGQDNNPTARTAFLNPPIVAELTSNLNNIDIAGDRNLYLVPGESDVLEQRVVTGVENISQPILSVQAEPREVELDGENLEDQQQQQQQHQTFVHTDIDLSSREEPIEGANTLDADNTVANQNLETESSLTVETNIKEMSTGNESDARDRHSVYSKSRKSQEKKYVSENASGKDKRHQRYRKDNYDSEDSELSSDHERRNYRESSVRGDRDYKDRKRKDYDKNRRDKYTDDNDSQRDKKDRDSRYGGSKYDVDPRYKSDGRYDRRRQDKERDRDGYDDYHRDKDRYRKDRRETEDRDRRRGNDEREFRERRDRRERNRIDYEDNYRKASSRNARESDFEKDRVRSKEHRYSQNMYGYGSSGYGYDAYAYRDAYYQHQQYYEQLRRTNPQAYAEWYRKYYGQVQPDSLTMDGRESVHSGRSSANNEKDRYNIQHQAFISHPNEYHRPYVQPASASTSLNSTMIEQHIKPDSYGLSRGPSTSNLSQVNQVSEANYYSGPGRAYYGMNDYPKTRSENLSLNLMEEAAPSVQEPARLTPCKFTTSHTTVSLSTGVLVTVKPKYSQNGVSNIVKLIKIAANDATKRLFQSFPGPLVKGLTHKKTIIEFCEDQIRLGPPSASLRSRQNSTTSVCSVSQGNKASYTLMWNLLILLLRQNGVVVGTDIAELLLKNQAQFPYLPTWKTASNDGTSRRNSVLPEEMPSETDEPEVEDEPADTNIDSEQSASSEPTPSLTEEEITSKFRDYLLYGNVNEALDWATDNNLWGHALFLASKVDRRSHANVMMKFANKLALNDPLQTLYQLMSGRSPSSVTSVQDEKWGDWRPHLAMILSNTSSKPDLDRKSITTLGDSLYNRGDLFGAHFCYLMAQVGFGRYSSSNQEQTLLLSNATNVVRLVLLGSSHNKSFNDFATNEAIMMTEIYEYACSLNDDKFSIVEFQPYKYLLATRLLDYGYHLKSLMYTEQIALHIQRDTSKYEASFVEKIFNLADRLKFYDPALEKSSDNPTEDGSGAGLGGMAFEEQPWLQNLRAIVNQNTETTYPQYSQFDNGVAGSEYPTYQPEQPASSINEAFSEINRQFDQLNLQYTGYGNQQQFQQTPNVTDNDYNQVQPQEQVSEAVTQIQQPATDSYNQYYNPVDLAQQPTNPIQSYDQQPSQGLPPQNNAFTDEQDPLTVNQQQPSYDYWAAPQYGQTAPAEIAELPKPTISMPNATSNKLTNSHDEHNSEQRSSIAPVNKAPVSAAKKENPKESASSNGNHNSGWFGGIWNKLSLKPKNQMILPDDKNPAIVWDADKKRWVNTDGDADEPESFRPPPKLTEMGIQNIAPPSMPTNDPEPQQMPAMYNQQAHAEPIPQQMTNTPFIQTPTMSAAPSLTENTTKVPNLQSNMFKMQRNRTLKKSYVDVFNPSGAQPAKPAEQVLAPTLPPAVVPQSGFFIPSDSTNQVAQQQQDTAGPQFYNPNVYQQ